jgi:hypothetical protein
MKTIVSIFTATALLSTFLFGKDPAVFNTQWIPSQPEVLTYRSKSSQGDGLYQVSIMKKDTLIEVYINIISPGFTKTVGGNMTFEMHPIQSTGKIFVNNQIMMDTKCFYEHGTLRITTAMMPYNRVVTDTLRSAEQVVDFSQVPFLVRTLPLEKGAQYSFTSLNPQTNALVPLTLKVTGEGTSQKVDCYKVELNDFEGTSIYWVEKGAQHRVMLVEQPDSHRTTELLQ